MEWPDLEYTDPFGSAGFNDTIVIKWGQTPAEKNNRYILSEMQVWRVICVLEINFGPVL